jgi:hypothetical protein
MPYYAGYWEGFYWMGPPPGGSTINLIHSFTATDYIAWTRVTPHGPNLIGSGAHQQMRAMLQAELNAARISFSAQTTEIGIMTAQQVQRRAAERLAALDRAAALAAREGAETVAAHRTAQAEQFWQSVRNLPSRPIPTATAPRFVLGRSIIRGGFYAMAWYGYYLVLRHIYETNEGVIEYRERHNREVPASWYVRVPQDELGAQLNLIAANLASTGVFMFPGLTCARAAPIMINCSYSELELVPGFIGDSPETHWFKIPDPTGQRRALGLAPTFNYTLTYTIASGLSPFLSVGTSATGCSNLTMHITSQELSGTGTVSFTCLTGESIYIRLIGPENVAEDVNTVYSILVEGVTNGATCATAPTITAGVAYRGLAHRVSGPTDLWYKVTAPGGNYKLTFTIITNTDAGSTIPADAHVTTYTGSCEALVESIAPAPLGPPGTLCVSASTVGAEDLFIKVSAGDEGGVAFDMTFAAGTCS